MNEFKNLGDIQVTEFYTTLVRNFVGPGIFGNDNRKLSLCALLLQSDIVRDRFLVACNKIVIDVKGSKHKPRIMKDDPDDRYGVAMANSGEVVVTVPLNSWKNQTNFGFGDKFDRACFLCSKTQSYIDKTKEMVEKVNNACVREFEKFPDVEVDFTFVKEKYYVLASEDKKEHCIKFLADLVKYGYTGEHGDYLLRPLFVYAFVF